MKNASLAINAVLFVLIIVLFFMYSSLKKSINGDSGSTSTSTSTMPASVGKQKGARIAYVNADSINANYKLMRVFKDDVTQRQSALQNEYEVKGRKLQDEYQAYQQKAQAGNISQIDAQNAQKDMEVKKAELDGIQRKQDELLKEVQDKNLQIQQKIQNYIATFNKKAHFDFVLGYTNIGGTVLYANDSMDITRDIVSGINKMYQDSIQNAGAKH